MIKIRINALLINSIISDIISQVIIYITILMSWVDKITALQQQTSLDIAMRKSGVNDLLQRANKHIENVTKERNKKAKQIEESKEPTLNIQKQTRDYYKKKLEEKVMKCKQFLSIYQLETTNQERLRELLQLRTKEHNKLLDSNEGIKSAVNTNSRKVVYQKPQIDSIESTRLFVTIMYFSVFLVIIVNGFVITKSLHKNYKALVLLLIYFIFPFITDLFILRCYDILQMINKYLGEHAPKNVYKNL